MTSDPTLLTGRAAREALRGARVLVIGLGLTGTAAARTLHALGADVVAIDSRPAAAEAAAAAADLWRRRGEGRQATAASVRSDSLAAAHCEGAETPLLDTVRTTTPLTSREREISMLAAAGETSKEIAAALTLSVRTVDNHLQKAYAKLGIATRPVLLGPVTFLLLGKAADGTAAGFDRLSLLDPLLEVYTELLDELQAAGAEWVQLDEPAFIQDRSTAELDALATEAGLRPVARSFGGWPRVTTVYR